ncbi:peptidase [Halonotius aquaticus]|uniref:Peptidase n=1 Tax=Halonotius aquaticus TaxID=2216978 RepID=A0A3A6Q5L0_9EURY|nr:M48 family metalloprotease [Halonotius aquaticus]RJX42455.1 peptidase [Halonotius aquaticus]
MTAVAAPLQATIDPWWFVVAAVVLFLVMAALGPRVSLSLRETRSPMTDEQDALDALLAAADLDPPAIHISETADPSSIKISLHGLPGRRQLLLTEGFLDSLDDATATALLTAEAQRGRLFYLEYRAFASAIVIGVATAMFGGLIAFSNGLFVIALTALVLFWIGRQLQFRADRAAADRVGADALADAFEAVADHRGVDPEGATWRTYFEVQPPLGQRIDRLRADE